MLENYGAICFASLNSVIFRQFALSETPSRFHHIIALIEKLFLAGTAIGHAAKFSNINVVLNGGQNITFLRPDGYFSLYIIAPSSNNSFL